MYRSDKKKLLILITMTKSTAEPAKVPFKNRGKLTIKFNLFRVF